MNNSKGRYCLRLKSFLQDVKLLLLLNIAQYLLLDQFNRFTSLLRLLGIIIFPPNTLLSQRHIIHQFQLL